MSWLRARTPGLLYLTVILSGIFSIAYAPGRLFGDSDPAAMAASVGAQLPLLRAAIAVGVPHPSLGEAVVLCAIPREGAATDGEALRGFLRERLAPYKVPRCVLFFRPDELAYTGNQKIQSGPLREAALARLAAGRVEIAGHVYGGG